jgi:hypothetical protein
MAAKKTRKPTKKPRSKAAKPARKPKTKPTRPAPKKRDAARAKVRAKKAAQKPRRAAAKPKRRPIAKAPARKPKKSTVKKAAPKRKAEKAVRRAQKRAAAPARRARAEKKAPKPKKVKAAKPARAPKPVKAEKVARAERNAEKAEKKAAKAEKRVVEAKPEKKAKAPPPAPSAPKGKKIPEARKSGEGKAKKSEAPPAHATHAGDRPRAVRDDRRSQTGLKGGKLPSRPPLREAPARLVSLPLPILQPPKRPSVEERSASIDTRLNAQPEEFRKRYEDSLDMSWIYHDSALEGVVYTFEELRNALSGQAPPVTDSSLQPTYDDIKRHKEAIEFVRDFGLRKKLPVTVDIIKKIYLILHPEEGDIKTVKYRKDIPQHRLYFHEYAPPDKIAYKVRQIVDWLNDPETRKTRNGIRIAARAHYDLLRVYPFPTDSGKVSRLFMNLLLMRSGLPPSIIHSTERQRYYEALKGSATTVLQMVQEAVENALSSVEKLLDEHETRKRAFVS